MRLSEIGSAKGLKIKLNIDNHIDNLKKNCLLRIEQTGNIQEFIVSPYGKNIQDEKQIICRTGQETAEYLYDIFDGERNKAFRCMFTAEDYDENHIEVQTYIFDSVTEYKTPIYIAVNDELLKEHSIEKIYNYFVWDQLGVPALFCLNYKNQRKKNSNVRFTGGRKYLAAQVTARGIVADKILYQKEKYDLPVDLFIAPEIKFTALSEHNTVNSELNTELEKISNPASYFSRWEAYEKLTKKLLEVQRDEVGEISYSSYSVTETENGLRYEFKTDDYVDESLKGLNLGVMEKSSSDIQNSENKKKNRQTDVGIIQEISAGSFITHKDIITDDILPASGVLKLFMAGDNYIMARRAAARDRMIKHRSPVKSIVALIETGTSGYELPSAWNSHKPITEDFRSRFSKASDLNSAQIKALDTAINTPDIAIIQGPPGTGKTTVIKAICERFRELFEAEERRIQKVNPEHSLRSPKILISSFQNDAVDNAISAPLSGDIPAYRKTSRRVKESTKEQYSRSLDKWYNGLYEKISDKIEEKSASEFLTEKRELDDMLLSYRNSGEKTADAAAIIKRYLDYPDIKYPDKLLENAGRILDFALNESVKEDTEDPLVSKLRLLRVTPEEFEDDGNRNARRLLAYISINDEYDISEDAVEKIQKICYEEYSENDFEEYANIVRELQKKYCKARPVFDPNNKDSVNECLLALSNVFSSHYMDTLSSVEGKKSLVLSEFLYRLEQDYESIVKKYSMTTAATCQTCLDLREESDKIYDLVVIDEAARANPLDIFIPMSMGRKIILVGDHKQLPHMLEADVLKMLEDDPKFEGIEELEKSLFERLFEMFSKGHKPKAVLLTDQFRMHPDICRFVSESFYDGMLNTAPGITPEMKSSSPEINGGKPLAFIDIPISRGTETNGISKCRQAEADVICQDVRKIIHTDLKASIGIITFYSAQAKLIERQLKDNLNDEELERVDIGTVDAFQGKEYDYVLLSCVRSNRPDSTESAPKVGFLDKPNRLCVAFSRSVRQLAVYGDAETLISVPVFAKLYDICSQPEGGYFREA